MKRLLNDVLSGILAALPLIALSTTDAHAPRDSPHPVQSAQRLNVVFDTDVHIDDTLALAMLHALQDRGEVKLIAVTISTDNLWCASYIDLLDTFYGHADIPVGIVHGGIELGPRFPQLISQRKEPDGSTLYPHHLIDGAKAPEAVSLLRKILKAQDDGSVIIVSSGPSINLAHLLESRPDASSSLNGGELVRRKVRLLSVMAGQFRQIQWDGKNMSAGHSEYNLSVDVPSAQKVFLSWPTAIVVSGFEVGSAMMYRGENIMRDYTYAKHHPIVDSYQAFCEEKQATGHSEIRQCPQDHDHGTFDLTAVLYAVRPDRNYFSLSSPGTITVTNDGGSRFQESVVGRHRYLVLTDEQRARTLEAMETLASQPPANATRAALPR